MEEMRGTAMAYYANMSNDQQQMVQSFYESIDTNGNGKVSVQEFLDFLEQKGYSRRYMPPNLFKLLDENNDGTLDFEECVTLFYMLTGHRRVICDGCQSYLWGLYFLCVDCYSVPEGNTYDLCCSCYRNKNFSHAHSSFLDNYALLRINRSKVQTSERQEETCNVKTSKGRVSKREMIKGAVENCELVCRIGKIGVQTVNAATVIVQSDAAQDVAAAAIDAVDAGCTIM